MQYMFESGHGRTNDNTALFAFILVRTPSPPSSPNSANPLVSAHLSRMSQAIHHASASLHSYTPRSTFSSRVLISYSHRHIGPDPTMPSSAEAGASGSSLMRPILPACSAVCIRTWTSSRPAPQCPLCNAVVHYLKRGDTIEVRWTGGSIGPQHCGVPVARAVQRSPTP